MASDDPSASFASSTTLCSSQSDSPPSTPPPRPIKRPPPLSALRSRRVSFSEPTAPLKIQYPGAASAWDSSLIWTLGFVAFAMRFYRLALPSSVVFDELHFGKFVDNVLKREMSFDIHPPLGKLTLALFGWLAGYRPVAGFNYDPIGKDYMEVLYYPMREVAAVFGAATVPLLYATARRLGMSWVGALVASGLYCFDNLNVIESRLILMDSQIMFYLVLSLYCALELWKTPPRTWKRLQWLSLTGIVCGCSMSVKWTALATPALIAIVSFFGAHFLNEPLAFTECAWAGLCGLSVYVFFFWVHFELVLNDGPGAAFYPDEVQRTLVGHRLYDPEALRPSFLNLFWYLNKTMLYANASIAVRHQWESYWYQWVVNWRGLLYSSKQDWPGERWVTVYLMCNPIVCWVCGVCVTVVLSLIPVICRYPENKFLEGDAGVNRMKAYGTCIFLVLGWLCNLLPYILVDRSAFVYHYLPGLLYAQLLTGMMIDQLPRKLRVATMSGILGGAIAGFLYFAPWTYAVPLYSHEHSQMRWFGRWD